MSDITQRTLEIKADELEAKVILKSPSSFDMKAIIEKSQQFMRWLAAPKQTELDLSIQKQVHLYKATMRCDKPRKTAADYSLGFSVEKLDPAKAGDLYNLMQKGSAVEVIVRELPKQAFAETVVDKDTGEVTP